MTPPPPATRSISGPGSYVVLKYVRPLIKRKDDHTLHCPPAPPAPPAVIEGGRADVSFLAGVLVDKFLYHLPLYRQHQRLTAAGIQVSCQWLTQLVLASARLLAPIVEAQWAAIRRARVKAMDETPIKAGRKGEGQAQARLVLAHLGRYRRRRGRRPGLPLPILACGPPCTRGLGRRSGRRRRADQRRLQRLCALCRAHRHRPCPMLGAYAPYLRACQGHRAGGRCRSSDPHRRAVCLRTGDPRRGSPRPALCSASR